MSEDPTVQPSPPLIAELQSRLRDPSIVPRYETRRSNDSVSLIRPHWVLHRADIDAHSRGNDNAAVPIHRDKQGDSVQHANKSAEAGAANSIPQRNYIDLRLQQNKLFADERYQQCTKLLSNWKESRSNDIHGVKANEARNKQWEKMKSCIEEGLAAYPDHEMLVGIQNEMKEIANAGREVIVPSAHNMNSSSEQKYHQTESQQNAAGWTTRPRSNIQLKHPRKGAEGRAHAAMRDALLERNFLSDRAAASESADGYTLLPEDDGLPSNTLLKSRESDASSDGTNSIEDSHKNSRKKRKQSKGRHRDKHAPSDDSCSSEERNRKKKRRKRDKHRKKHRHKHEKKKHEKSSL